MDELVLEPPPKFEVPQADFVPADPKKVEKYQGLVDQFKQGTVASFAPNVPEEDRSLAKAILRSRNKADEDERRARENARFMFENSGDRRAVLDKWRTASSEERAAMLKYAPQVAESMRDERGGYLARSMQALGKGSSKMVAQPIMELVGLGGTDEEIAVLRQFDSIANETIAPALPEDPWYERGSLQAAEMLPWMITVIGSGGKAKGLAQAAGLGPKAVWAAETAGITAASYPGSYAQSKDELTAAGVPNGWGKKIAAGLIAAGVGALEAIIPNPFEGKVPLTQGARKAATRYATEVLKNAPLELSEEYFQGLWSGIGTAITTWFYDEAPDQSISGAFDQAWDQAKEAVLPLAFMLGAGGMAGTVGAGAYANQVTGEINKLEGVLDKGFVSSEDGKNLGLTEEEMKSRSSRKTAVQNRIDAIRDMLGEPGADTAAGVQEPPLQERSDEEEVQSEVRQEDVPGTEQVREQAQPETATEVPDVDQDVLDAISDQLDAVAGTDDGLPREEFETATRGAVAQEKSRGRKDEKRTVSAEQTTEQTPQFQSYEEFRDEYQRVFREMMNYPPDQVGSTHFAEQMSALADKYPEWADRAENETEEESQKESLQKSPREKAQEKQAPAVGPPVVPEDEAEATAEVDQIRREKRRGRKDQSTKRTVSGPTESTNEAVHKSKGQKQPETPQESVPAVQDQEAAKQPKTPQSGDTAVETADSPDVQLAKGISDSLFSKQKIDAKAFHAMAEKSYGGTRAEGAYDPSRANDALELGVNLHIAKARHAEYLPPSAGSTQLAKETIQSLDKIRDSIPPQTNRSGLKDAAQQFSTPPSYAYAVNWVANIGKSDTVLEPSAGTGSLAVHAKRAGATVYVNELKEVGGVPNRRVDLVSQIGADQVFTEDAEQIHNVLGGKIKPTVVVMNPPFSTAAGRMKGKKLIGTDLKHIDAALELLAPEGRLVAIIGAGLHGKSKGLQNWEDGLRGRGYDLRADIELSRDVYKGYGTTFPTRVLVIDKASTAKSEKPLTGKAESLYELIDILEGIRNDRVAITQQKPAKPASKEATPKTESRPGSEPSVSSPTSTVGVEGRQETGTTGGKGEGERTSPGGLPGRTEGRASTEDPKAVPEPRPTEVTDSGRGATNEGARGTSRTEVGGKPVRESSQREPDARPRTQLDVEAVEKKPKRKNELTDSVYEAYEPRRSKIKGSRKHPASIVESSAMSAVDPPMIEYAPDLPKETVESGALSDIQLEAISYAGHSHTQKIEIEGNEYRKGFLIGDGTGVGKGRTAAGIILDNIRQGRTKAVWVSKSQNLLGDSKEYSEAVGLPADKVFSQSKIKSGTGIEIEDGVLYSTYNTLSGVASSRAVAEGNVKSRLDQVVDWLGDDFDGAIVFDEAHIMRNAIDQKGSRGTKKASQVALAGLELQRRLPNARVVYMSATAATEVSNLAYAERLGLWGKGTPFANQEEFNTEITAGGVAAMEKVAADMKAMGLYVSRNISFNDGTPEGTVSYQRLEHTLTPEETATYDKMAEAWGVVFGNMNEALDDTGGKKDGRAVSAARSAFWGANQRFWNTMLTAIQTPAVIKQMENDLKEGRSAVIQLTNTNEAANKRALADREEGQSLEELDMSPRGILMDFVEKSFPVWQYEEYTDDNGNIRSRPVTDSEGNRVKSAKAVALQEQLLDELGSIELGSRGSIDMILDHFGVKNVAEITGRTVRLIKNKDGKLEKETRSKSKNAKDIKAFQSGKKRILIFSEAGGTGSSYHADRSQKNQEHRRHYLLQAGWRADVAVQGLGRTHRSNQAQAPSYVLVHTNLKGQKRFISTIARRLSQLGAITKGERQAVTGSEDSALFTASDNLESTEAKQALMRFYQDAVAGQIEGVGVDLLEDRLGLQLRSKETGSMLNSLPPITQFLNRVLSLPVREQNLVFDAFENRLSEQVEIAMARGELDQGVETVRADHIEKISDNVVYTHESGAETRHVKVNISRKSKPTKWSEIRRKSSRTIEFYVRSKRTGKVMAVSSTGTYEVDTRTGSQLSKARAISPLGVSYGHIEKLKNTDHYERLGETAAEEAWNAAVTSVPEFIESEEHFLTGVLLPIWDRISGENTRVMRMLTDAGEMILGRQIPGDQVRKTLKALGASMDAPKLTPQQAAEAVIGNNQELVLANDWRIQRRRVGGENRIELVGPSFVHHGELEASGVFRERIQSKTRYFIPTANAAEVIESVLEGRPITDVVGRAKSAGDKALDEAWDAAKDLNDQIEGKAFANPLQDAKLVLGVAKVTYKFAKAGTLKFAEFVEKLAGQIGQASVDKIMPVLKSEWAKLQKTGQIKGMEPLPKEDTVRAERETTGIKNAKTDEMREKLGMGPRQSPVPRGWDAVNAEAERIMRADPGAARRLAKEVSRNPRIGSDLEQMILERHITDLSNRLNAGEDVYEEIVTTVTASEELGAEASRSLGIRRSEMFDDFSLAGFIRQHLREFDEQPSSEWVKKYEEMAARVKEAEEQAESSRKQLAEQQAEEAIQKAQEAEREKKPKKGTKKSQRAELRSKTVAMFKKKWDSLWTVGAINDPKQNAEKWYELTKAARDVVKVYVETGVDSLLELLSLVKADLGDLTPDQEQAFREAWSTEKPSSPLGESPEPAEIGARAKNLMVWAVEQGITDREEVVDAVQSALEDEGIYISRVETMLAMSDYGIYRELPKDATSVKVREIRGELQQLMKLRDLEAGRIPSLTGKEQRTPSKEEERLAKEVYERMKKSGFSTTDPRKVTTPLQSKKKSVAKRLEEVDAHIRELTDNIKQGTPLKQDGQRTELKVDEELIRLQSELDQAILERDELRKESPEWQQREIDKARERYRKHLVRRLEFWEKRRRGAKKGILPEKRTVSSPFADEFRAANAKIDEVKAEAMAEIEKEKRRRWNLGQKIGHDLAEGTATVPRTLMAGLELSSVLRQGFFYTHSHPVLSLFNTVDSIGSVFSEKWSMAQEEDITKRSNYEEYADAGIEFTMESGPRDRMEEVYQSSLFKWLSHRKNPVKYVGKAYGAFERGFRNFTNTMRADLYDIQKRDTLAAREWFSKHGIGRQGWSEQDMKTVGRSANIWSGRGTGLMPNKSFLDWLLFARRWVWSRVQAEFILPFQLATPSFIGQWNGDAAMRVSHAKLYGQAIIGAAAHLAAVYWIMSLLADDDDDKPTIEWDWRATDLWKPRVGETRIDVLGGLPQLLVFASRLMSGQTKTSSGEIKDLRGPDADPFAPGAWDAFAQMVRYKLGPSASGIVDFFDGKTAVGEKLPEEPMQRAAQIVGRRMTPMAYSDMWEAEKQLGVKQGTFAAIEAFFGASVNTYGLRTKFTNSGQAEQVEQFDKYLKGMKWDSPDPPYSDLLTDEQKQQVIDRRRYKSGSVIYLAASDPPDPKRYLNDETFAEGQARYQKSLQTLAEMRDTVPLQEAIWSLARYSIDRGLSNESYDKRVRKLRDFYNR